MFYAGPVGGTLHILRQTGPRDTPLEPDLDDRLGVTLAMECATVKLSEKMSTQYFTANVCCHALGRSICD